jgi:hypothetical protein
MTQRVLASPRFALARARAGAAQRVHTVGFDLALRAHRCIPTGCRGAGHGDRPFLLWTIARRDGVGRTQANNVACELAPFSLDQVGRRLTAPAAAGQPMQLDLRHSNAAMVKTKLSSVRP